MVKKFWTCDELDSLCAVLVKYGADYVRLAKLLPHISRVRIWQKINAIIRGEYRKVPQKVVEICRRRLQYSKLHHWSEKEDQ